MHIFIFFLLITNPCPVLDHGPVLGHDSGPRSGPSSRLRPKLVPVQVLSYFWSQPWSQSWSRHISGPGLGPGPSQNFWSRHTVARWLYQAMSIVDMMPSDLPVPILPPKTKRIDRLTEYKREANVID